MTLPYEATCEVSLLGARWTLSAQFDATGDGGGCDLGDIDCAIKPATAPEAPYHNVLFTELPGDVQGEVEMACVEAWCAEGQADWDRDYDFMKEQMA